MKTIQNLAFVAAVLVLLGASTRAQEFPKPGPEHEQLKQMVGIWEGNLRSTFEPGKSPLEGKGMFEAKMDLGGYFLVTEFKGEIGDKPFQGRGVTGYDPLKKKYTGVWVDSMSPAIHTTEGAFDKSGKVFSEAVECYDPKGTPIKTRVVTTIKDKDHMHFQTFVEGKDGKESMTMEIAYTRRK